MISLEKYIKLLKDNGLKVTHQRLAILKYLESNMDHPTVERIYSDLKIDNPSLSKTTVYNTLEVLRENNIIHSLTISPTEQRYDMKTTQHHHFMCKKCGILFDLDFSCPHLEKVFKEHKIEEVHGYFKGICRKCLESHH